MGNAGGKAGGEVGKAGTGATGSSEWEAMMRLPLSFHPVHGEHVRLSAEGRVARRVESFCKGLAFSARPVAIDEIVCLKFTEISTNWSGVLRFGLTNTDPASLAMNLPRFACPDLTSKEGNWAKALAEKYCHQGTILHFYVSDDGELFYGVNGVQKGQFLSGINTRAPLWVLLDIYGNSTALEFLDPADVPPLRRRRDAGVSASTSPAASTPPSTSTTTTTSVLAAELSARTTLPQSSRYHTGVGFRPLCFHATTGQHISLSASRTIASRTDVEYTHGYVFTARPLRVGEKLVLQVLATLPAYDGGLALGLTACDPAHLTPASFPADSDLLLDRSEYWVVAKDVASKPRRGDELAFYIGRSGEIYFYKNNGSPRVIMHVDPTQALWMFFDVYGNTAKIQSLGVTEVSSTTASSSAVSKRRSSQTSQSQPEQSEVEQNLINFGPPSPNPSPPTTAPPPLPPASHATPSTSLAPQPLRVNLPPPESTPRRPPRSGAGPSTALPPPPSIPPPSPYARPPIAARAQPPPTPPPRPPPLRAASVSYSHQQPSSSSATPALSTPARLPPRSASEDAGNTAAVLGDECSVCMSSAVDCVLYTCGHMCMCFDCAQEVRFKSGECPICRQMIVDVIKAFKA